uniref:RING-type domain-containing protein n=1 Tax=Kalanchoe fedtschenkoi TaxID=63787 RepID=A0A7N0UP38_KALFE
MMMMMLRRLQQQHTIELHNVNTGDSCSPSGFAASLDEKQIDQYIMSQYERLRWAVHEQRKRDLASILNRVETKSRHVLKQQDEEMIRARSRAAQLELTLLEVQTEQQQWKKLALDTDAQLIRLSNAVEQMRSDGDGTEEGDDAESCCDAGDQIQRACRRCGFKEACVVLLPCRHMCSCVACEPLLGWCPVCTCVKQGAIAIEPPCPFIS